MRSSKSTMRFLPALVLVLLAVLPAYVGSLWTGVAGLALAEEAAPAAVPAAPEAGAAADHAAAAAGAEHPAEAVAADEYPAQAATESAETFDPLTLTKAEIDVLRQLAKRRDELDARAKALDDREALLKATEQKIAEQAQQMQQMKAEYQQMKSARDDAAEANLRRLVTVYESMKPEEAARIFETMEGAVLLDVVTRMGERRLAPILAQMSPAKAQALTIAMANRRALVPAAQPQG
jgi:flagellar motility protein MotE (MotC chaperone)